MTTDEVIRLGISIVGRVLLAAVIFLVGRYLAGLARSVTQRVVARPQVAEVLSPTIERLIVEVAYYGIIVPVIGLCLIALGVPATFVLTVTTIVLVLLGLALQESLANFAATIIFLVFQPFRHGELVETMGRLGIVQEIQLFNTVLLLGDQRVVSLPNSKIQDSGVINYSRMGIIRADISLTVGYGEDLGRVRAVLADILANDSRVLASPPIEIMVQELGDNGVRLETHAIVPPDQYWAVLSDLREQIKARFDADGIRFALPQRDVRLANNEDSDERNKVIP